MFIPLFPDRASTFAIDVDTLFFFLTAITGLVAVGVMLTLLVFCIRYRRRSPHERTPRIEGSIPLELFWTITPFLIFLVMFGFGASVYSSLVWPPADALEVFVVGKQWMWKVQHPGGQREINELHIPLNRPVKVTLISEDVIHDFFVPAFRTKIDVLPGRYVQTWFQPTMLGNFHLFCSQYCGTGHATMVGTVHVMDPRDYESWLNSSAEGSLALQGRKLFLKMQCITCHSADPRAHAPVLEDLYNTRVPLSDGRTVLANDAYIRESILDPRAKIVQGWQPIMPTFQGQVSEDDVIQLIAFIRSLHRGQTPVRTEEFPAPIGAPTTPQERRRTEQESVPTKKRGS